MNDLKTFFLWGCRDVAQITQCVWLYKDVDMYDGSLPGFLCRCVSKIIFAYSFVWGCRGVRWTRGRILCSLFRRVRTKSRENTVSPIHWIIWSHFKRYNKMALLWYNLFGNVFPPNIYPIFDLYAKFSVLYFNICVSSSSILETYVCG